MFISNAFAETAGTVAGGGFMENIMPTVFLVGVGGYLIYTQIKRGKEQRAMISAIERGDEVVTIGGELGRVSKVYEAYLVVELAENLEVTLQKTAIQTVLPKGTIKSIK